MNSRLTTHWQRLPEASVRKLQAAKLRHFLKTVVLPFSPYYRELFETNGLKAESIRTLEDLQSIPFTTKADLVNSPEKPKRALDFLIRPDAAVLKRRASTIARALVFGRQAVTEGFEEEFRPIFMTSTTGRSADPIPFLYTRHDLATLAMGGDRIMQVCEADHDFRLINMFPYAPHLAFWLAHYASSAFGIFMVGSGGGKVLGTEGNLRLIEKIKPDGLIGMPTFLYHVLHQAVEEGLKCPNLQRLVLGGEKVAPGMRKKLRQLAAKMGAEHVHVLATYGFTESKMAWAECPHPAGQPSSGYHIYPDQGLFEVVDPKTGKPLPPGQPGELVFTPLDARGTVVLRYRTGDIVDGGMFYDTCPYCHRTLPRIVGKISRNSEVKSMQLDKIKGTLVDFNQLEHVLDDAPSVRAWQLELRKVNDDPMELDELILHVNKAKNVPDSQVIRELTNRFVERTEVSPNDIRFHDAETLRSLLGVGTELKELKIIDNRPGQRNGKQVAGSRPVTNNEAATPAASGPVETVESSTSTANPTEVTT